MQREREKERQREGREREGERQRAREKEKEKERERGNTLKFQQLQTFSSKRWDHIWVPVLIPADLLPIKFSRCGPAKQLRITQSLGALHLRVRRGSGSMSLFLKIAALAVEGPCRVSASVVAISASLCLLLSIYLTFQSKQIHLRIEKEREKSLQDVSPQVH